MKNKGYTVIELLIVIVVVGVISFTAINKASYAFSEEVEELEELEIQKQKLIENQAANYGESNKDLFDESNTIYIRVKDLIEGNYLKESFSSNGEQKIKIVLDDDKVSAYLEK